MGDNEIPSVRNGRAMELQPTFEEKRTLLALLPRKESLEDAF